MPHPLWNNAGLVLLDLTRNNLSRLPPALATATSLRELSLAEIYDLALTDDDVDTLLCLPFLRRLYLDVTKTPAYVLAGLLRAAPELQIAERWRSIEWRGPE